MSNDRQLAPEDAEPSRKGDIKAQAMLGVLIDDKYKIEALVGRGGIGMVYRAKHILMDRIVAIKVLHPHLIENEESLKRFQHEAQIASKLNHPNAVLIYDYGIYNGAPYIVMEYAQGVTLKDEIKEHGALSVERTYEILNEVSAALKEAHAIGIVHRDLKPDNIIISKKDDGEEQVQVLDFGIAKLLSDSGAKSATIVTQAGMFFGTPHYASPEQALGKELDKRSDIYSLGIILFECLAGSCPFDAPSIMEVLMLHVNKEPPSLTEKQPKLRAHFQLDAVIKKSLAKEPAARYQSVEEFLAAIKNALADPAPTFLQETPSSHGSFFALGVVVLVLALMGGGVFYLLSSSETEPETVAMNGSEIVPKGNVADEGETVTVSPQNSAAEKPELSAEGREAELLAATALEEFVSEVADSSVLVAVNNQSDEVVAAPSAEVVSIIEEKPKVSGVKTEQVAISEMALEVAPSAIPTPVATPEIVVKAEEPPTPEKPAKPLTSADIARLYREGDALYRKRNYAAAITKLEQAVAANPAFVKARLSLGICYLRLKRMAEAYLHFSEALKADPTYPPTHFNFACYYALTKNPEKSLAALRLAIEYEPAARRWAMNEPDLSSLKGSERFKQLVR